MKRKQTHRLREEIYGCWGEWGERGVWDEYVHMAIFKIDNQQRGFPVAQWQRICLPMQEVQF